MGDFDELTFSDAYTFQSSMESSVMELLNQNMLDSLEEAGDNSMFSKVYSGGIGTLEYYTDGYENVTVESMTEDMLDEKSYSKEKSEKRDCPGWG